METIGDYRHREGKGEVGVVALGVKHVAMLFNSARVLGSKSWNYIICI